MDKLTLTTWEKAKMFNVLILSLVVLSLYAENNIDGYDLYVWGLSYHTNRDNKYNEINPGVGFGIYAIDMKKENFQTQMAFHASCYWNSYNDPAATFSFGPRFILGNVETFHVDVSLDFGFMAAESYDPKVCGFILPGLSVGYDKMNVQTVFVPKVGREDTAVIGMMVRYSFY